MNNAVVKKYFIRAKPTTASPLCISSGSGSHADSDILVDSEGVAFVPGSTIAGAMRAYLRQDDAAEQCSFGRSDGEQGYMSSVYINDMPLSPAGKVSVRDGVRLENKVVVSDSKYDYEILETGATGILIIEVVIRQNDISQNRDHIILDDVMCGLYGISIGEIRLGYKKNRGNGKFVIDDLRSCVITKENAEQAFGIYKKMIDSPQEIAWTNPLSFDACKGQFIHIHVPLRLVGGISIRQYAAKKNEPDFEHVTCAGKPVIPGSSWNGAIRSRLLENMVDAGRSKQESESVINAIFGYVTVGERYGKACQSHIIVNESVIEGAEPLHIIRNQISRFESSTKDGALYQELSYFGGGTTLEIVIRKIGNDDDDTPSKILAYLMPVIEDIRQGFLAVGGQTAVGRGVFAANGPIFVNGEEWHENI